MSFWLNPCAYHHSWDNVSCNPGACWLPWVSWPLRNSYVLNISASGFIIMARAGSKQGSGCVGCRYYSSTHRLINSSLSPPLVQWRYWLATTSSLRHSTDAGLASKSTEMSFSNWSMSQKSATCLKSFKTISSQLHEKQMPTGSD